MSTPTCPKFHNYGYDKPGGNDRQNTNENQKCWHTNSPNSADQQLINFKDKRRFEFFHDAKSCQQTCDQDETIFNPGQSNKEHWIDRAILPAVLKEKKGVNTYGGFAYGDKNVNAWIDVDAPLPWSFAHNGECSAGSEILMYKGDGDNEGDANGGLNRIIFKYKHQIKKCGNACLKKENPQKKDGIWTGFTAKGFIMAESGRCWCESAESSAQLLGNPEYLSEDSCDRKSSDKGCNRYSCGSYTRYDFTKNYEFAHDGECSAGSEIRMYEGNGDNSGNYEQKLDNCAKACTDEKSPLSGSWDGFTAKGFVMASSGRCYCESAESTTEAQMSSDSCASGGGGCGRYSCGSYKRYDFT